MSKNKKKNNYSKQILQGMILLGISLSLSLCLVSYCDGDSTRNWLGLVGHVCGWAAVYLLGFSSWLVPVFLGWLGWKRVRKREIEGLPLKIFYFITTLFSLAVLLAMLAQASPSFSSIFEKWIYSDYYPRKTSYDPACLRHYLGGVPMHHLYIDTGVSMRRLFGNMGTFLIFVSLFLLSTILLTDFPLKRALDNLQRLMKGFLKAAPRLVPVQIRPIQKRPFGAEELEIEEEDNSSLVREDPLKRETRIKILEAKPPSKSTTSTKPIQIGDYTLPPSTLLTEVAPVDQSSLKSDLKRQAKVLEETLLSFGIEAKVGDIHCGPTITSFEVHPAVGVKVQKIKALENDIALNMQAKSIRIIAPPARRRAPLRRCASRLRSRVRPRSGSRFLIPIHKKSVFVTFWRVIKVSIKKPIFPFFWEKWSMVMIYGPI